MKGVFIDENLPAGLQLPTDLPVSHVTAMSESPPDTVVWNYARKRSLVIVTKDADFSHRILRGWTPAAVPQWPPETVTKPNWACL